MTDKEIIKALELCASMPPKCEECPYNGHDWCVEESVKDTSNLIQRQQKEISALITGQETLQKHFAEKLEGIVEQLEAEKYRGMESLEPVLISFNFGINKAIEIVKGGAE